MPEIQDLEKDPNAGQGKLVQRVTNIESQLGSLNPNSIANLVSSDLRITLQSFGGTGADGSLSITSGTTTIDLGNADYFVKNYTSISITGTGKLAFSNPGTNGTIISLKSQGSVTLTSSTAPMIDCSSLGSAGGAATTSSTLPGNSGSLGNSILIQTNYGGGGGVSNGVSASAGGSGSTAISYILSTSGKLIRVSCGAGGGGGGSNGTDASGAGGRGGGALIIECGGELNFTTASGISVAGVAGTQGSASSAQQGGVGGGGGGSGGTCAIIYKTLIANTGTITVTGGNGGAGRDGSTTAGGVEGGGGGGGGGANRYAGGIGGGGGASGANGVDGTAGSGTSGGTGGAYGNYGGPTGNTGGGGGGGGGSAGNSYVVENTEFF